MLARRRCSRDLLYSSVAVTLLTRALKRDEVGVLWHAGFFDHSHTLHFHTMEIKFVKNEWG